MRTWEKDPFRRISVAASNRFSSDVTHELSLLGSVVAAVGGLVSLVTVSGGPRVLTDTYCNYLCSGYDRKRFEYPIFDLRLLRPCLQKLSSSFFGSWIIVHAVPTWGREQYSGCAAPHRGLPQRDCKKDWRRQFNGITQSLLFFHLPLHSHVHCVVLP